MKALKAIVEAEAYKGPSLIIAYAPCEMHSIKGGMENCQKEMDKAVSHGAICHAFNAEAVGGRHAGDVGKNSAGNSDLALIGLKLDHIKILPFRILGKAGKPAFQNAHTNLHYNKLIIYDSF